MDARMVDLEHVPTCAELTAMGLAYVIERTVKGNPSVYKLTAEGQALVYAAMARNAAAGRAADEARFSQNDGTEAPRSTVLLSPLGSGKRK
jgi:hypothetical protein